MNYKKLILASIAGFLSVFLFEMIWHGFLMKGMYDATSEVWRPEEDHNMPLMFLSQLLFAGSMAFVYTVFKPALKCKIGLQYGFSIGLIMAMPALGTYCYMPIPLTISLMWMVAALLKCILCGITIGFIFKDKKTNET